MKARRQPRWVVATAALIVLYLGVAFAAPHGAGRAYQPKTTAMVCVCEKPPWDAAAALEAIDAVGRMVELAAEVSR